MNNLSNHPLYRRHNLDSALSSLWTFYRKYFLSLFLISLIMSFILQYASTFIDLKELQKITDPELLMSEIKSYMVPILIVTVLNLFMVTILQYYIIYYPLDDQNNILVSFARSLKYFVPYLIIMVLLAFAGSVIIALGIIALIIGVFLSILYIMTLYMFILPVMMVEGTNIAHVITRSLRLTHRNFWVNIGWVATLLIIMIVVSVILSGIILIPFTGSFLRTIVDTHDTGSVLDLARNPLFFSLSSISNALIFPLMPVFACILYFNGLAGEENIAPPQETPEDKVKVEDLYSRSQNEENENLKND